MQLGMIGLGRMGAPLVRRLIRPDHMAALLDRELCSSCARLRTDRPAAVKSAKGGGVS